MLRNLMTAVALLGASVAPTWSLLPGGEAGLIKLGAAPSRASAPLLAGRSAAVDTVQTYETEHFFLVYSVIGVHKLVLTDGNISETARPNIEWIGEFAEKSWRLAIDTMGYKAPPMTATKTWYYKETIPKGKFPIEILDMGTADIGFRGQPYMGYSISPTPENGGLSQILLENDFLYDSAGVQKSIRMYMNPRVPGGDSLLADYSNIAWMWDGWYTAVAHELYHCIQMSYEYTYLEAFHELTASWFAMRATKSFPAVHHWGLNQTFLNQSKWDMFSTGNANANAPFIRALAKYAGEDFVRKLWEWRSKNITAAALTPEPIWFRNTAVTLGLDVYGFLDYFTSEVGCMWVNAVCDLNDSGLYRSVLPPIKYINVSFGNRDTASGVIGMPVAGWGTDVQGLGPIALASGYSRFRIERGSDTIPHSGFVLHLPSKTFTPFSFRNGNPVVEKRSDDTLLVFYGFSGGTRGSGLTVYATNAPVTPSGVSRRGSAVPADIKAVYDLRGRPVQGKQSTGITYELDTDGVVRRKVRWE